MRAISPFCRFVLLVVAVAAMAACGRPKDPNDPKEVGMMEPEVLQRNLKWASDFINERVGFGEIDEAKGKEMLREHANKLLDSIDLSQVEDIDAWRYGEIFRTAQKWEMAENVFDRASKFAKQSANHDRFVNDTLHLAEAQANQGKIDEAIASARSTFDVDPKDKAPILMSVLYESAPPMLGKGKDLEVAELLIDAIAQHRMVIVDVRTEGGAAFYATRLHHMNKAWGKIFEIYDKAKRPDLAKKAQDIRHQSSSRGI